MSALRVYDSDFVEHGDDLRRVVTFVLESYHGNWDAMIEWKKVASHRSLSDSNVRTILNMALSDSNQSVMWPVIRQAAGTQERVTQAHPEPRLRIVREPEPIRRQVIVRMKVNLKGKKYGRCNTKNGVIHVIDLDRTYVDWAATRLQHEPWHDFEHRTPFLNIKWKCSHYGPNTKVTLFDEIPEEIGLCKTPGCFKPKS